MSQDSATSTIVPSLSQPRLHRHSFHQSPLRGFSWNSCPVVYCLTSEVLWNIGQKIHKQFTLYLSCFQRQYHIDDTVKTSYQFGMYSEHLELNYHNFFRSPNLLCIFSLIIGTLYGLALFLKAPLSPFQGRVEGFSFNDHNLLAITASILFLFYELTVTT